MTVDKGEGVADVGATITMRVKAGATAEGRYSRVEP
jgi:hypothetical protein